MKKFLCLGIIASLTIGSLNITSIQAKESPVKEIQKEEFLELDDFNITIKETAKKRTVVTYDKVKKETSTVILDKNTNALIDENGNYIGTASMVNSRKAYGPFKTYFDVNPTSVGTIIGSILAVTAIVTTAGTAGVGLATLKTALNKLFTYGGGGSLVNEWSKGFSVNGYFQFSQEFNSNMTKARNLNRKLYVRIRKGSYSTYSFGNGSWFETTKP